jgi:hypothetical protein
MLAHKSMGPNKDGRFLVVYDTPGCCVPTVACDCGSLALADVEAARLNAQQICREKAIRGERELLGQRLVHQELEAAGNELVYAVGERVPPYRAPPAGERFAPLAGQNPPLLAGSKSPTS